MYKISFGCLSVAVALGGVSRTPAPAFGPGGVIATMRHITAALDAGDAKALRQSFDLTRETHTWVEESGAEGHMGRAGEDGALTAVGADGEPFEVAALTALPARLLQVTGADSARKVSSKMVAVRADCASAECSFAVADVERTYDAGSEAEHVVRVRVTALMRYDNDAHGFRVFHWHESVRPK
ncbi:MAG: hypothetical protein R3F56_01560 [Planctomycetota bacterium]